MTEQEQAIDSIATALKQVLAVDPQLLYKAAQKCNSDYFLDKIKADLENKPKLADRLLFRGAMCQLIVATLIRTGRAHLDDDDVGAMAFYMQFINQSK